MSGSDDPPGGRTGRRFGADLLSDLFATALEPGYAAAAERRRIRGPVPVGRRRLGRAGTALMLLVFGFLLATGYHQATAQQPQAARARAKLVRDVKSRQDETDRLQRQDDALRAEVARQRDRQLTGDQGAATARRLGDLEAVTGLGGVRGPGVSVTLADAPAGQDPVTGKPNPDSLGRVLDVDLQTVVNQLWWAGAEAVAVDGQRLAANSTIRLAGEAILVDFRPVSSPYRIDAVGPGSMRSRFERSAVAVQYRGFAKRYHMGFVVRSQSSLRLPAAPEPVLRRARPVPSASRSGGGR